MGFINDYRRQKAKERDTQVADFLKVLVADARGEDIDAAEAGALIEGLGTPLDKIEMVSKAIEVREVAVRQQQEAEADFADLHNKAIEAKNEWSKQLSRWEDENGPWILRTPSAHASRSESRVYEAERGWNVAEDTSARAQQRASGVDVDKTTAIVVKACRAAGLEINASGAALRVDPIVILLAEGRLPEGDELAPAERASSSTDEILARLMAKKAEVA